MPAAKAISLSLFFVFTLFNNSAFSLGVRCENTLSNGRKILFFESYRESVALELNVDLRTLGKIVERYSPRFNNWDEPTMLRLLQFTAGPRPITLSHLELVNRTLISSGLGRHLSPDLVAQVAQNQKRMHLQTGVLLNFLINSEVSLKNIRSESHLPKSILLLNWLSSQNKSIETSDGIINQVVLQKEQHLEDSLTLISAQQLGL